MCNSFFCFIVDKRNISLKNPVQMQSPAQRCVSFTEERNKLVFGLILDGHLVLEGHFTPLLLIFKKTTCLIISVKWADSHLILCLSLTQGTLHSDIHLYPTLYFKGKGNHLRLGWVKETKSSGRGKGRHRCFIQSTVTAAMRWWLSHGEDGGIWRTACYVVDRAASGDRVPS